MKPYALVFASCLLTFAVGSTVLDKAGVSAQLAKIQNPMARNLAIAGVMAVAATGAYAAGKALL